MERQREMRIDREYSVDTEIERQRCDSDMKRQINKKEGYSGSERQMKIDREYSETQRQRKELKRWRNRQGNIDDNETQTFLMCV